MTKTFGILSCVFGAVAGTLAFVAHYAESIYDPLDWFILAWMDGSAALGSPASGTAEMRSSSIFALTEANAITWTYAGAIALSVMSVSTAVVAEMRREPTLYLSAGVTLGIIAAARVDLYFALASLAVAVCSVAVLRRRNRANDILNRS